MRMFGRRDIFSLMYENVAGDAIYSLSWMRMFTVVGFILIGEKELNVEWIRGETLGFCGKKSKFAASEADWEAGDGNGLYYF